jgi:tRNA(fMet)-specific endonuclease VapC
VTKLLDTSVLVDFLRGEKTVIKHMAGEEPGSLAISTLTVDELTTGAALTRETQRELFSMDLLLRPLRTIPLDARIAARAGLLRAAVDRSGAPMDTADRLIAATALELGAVLVTSNTRDFRRVPFLVTEDWRAA